MPVYHYTSRVAAQDIACSGVLRTGPSGVTYLTTDDYSIGWQAANALSIVGKPVECRIGLHIDPPPVLDTVGPLYDNLDNLLRQGGGTQFVINGQLPVAPENISPLPGWP